MSIEPKSKLYSGAIEHRLNEATFIELICTRVHYEMILKENEQRKWFEYLGIREDDRIYLVETAKIILAELDELEGEKG